MHRTSALDIAGASKAFVAAWAWAPSEALLDLHVVAPQGHEHAHLFVGCGGVGWGTRQRRRLHVARAEAASVGTGVLLDASASQHTIVGHREGKAWRVFHRHRNRLWSQHMPPAERVVMARSLVSCGLYVPRVLRRGDGSIAIGTHRTPDETFICCRRRGKRLCAPAGPQSLFASPSGEPSELARRRAHPEPVASPGPPARRAVPEAVWPGVVAAFRGRREKPSEGAAEERKAKTSVVARLWYMRHLG